MTATELKKNKKKITNPDDLREFALSNLSNDAYKNPELRKDIVSLRNKGYSLEDIQQEINNKYSLDMTVPTVGNIYNKEIAKATILDKGTSKDFKEHRMAMSKRYGRIVKIADFLLEAIEEVKNEFESSDMDKMQKYINFIKMTPHITRALDQVLSQLEFLKKEDERIKVEQQNLIYSPIQINQYLQESITDLVKEGYIKVLRNLPFEEDPKKTKKS
jgi:hypothetical protein